MADTQDLGSCAERREGSSPSFRTVSPSTLSALALPVDRPLDTDRLETR